MKNRKIKIFLLCFMTMTTVIHCENKKDTAVIQQGLKPIDIPSPGFFWLLRPWKKGTLATMDGKARFAEISFVGKNRMKITPLINFPMTPIDRNLVTAPESGICITSDSKMFFIADTVEKKTKSFMPLVVWRFDPHIPLVLDQKNGIVRFGYSAAGGYKEQPRYMIIYDIKDDKVLYESPEAGEENSFLYPFTAESIFCIKYKKDGTREAFFYNWKTKEITKNELTKIYTSSDMRFYISPGENINLEEHYLFAKLYIPGALHDKDVKVTWDENYEDVKVIPLDYMVPDGKWLTDFVISPDGKWAANFIGGYEGYYGEFLYKRVFFHLDSRYPNGISMPIYVDEYYENAKTFESFVEHPEYGLCFAEEKHKEEKNGKEKLYLRLYKMSDVLAEINKQLGIEWQ